MGARESSVGARNTGGHVPCGRHSEETERNQTRLTDLGRARLPAQPNHHALRALAWLRYSPQFRSRPCEAGEARRATLPQDKGNGARERSTGQREEGTRGGETLRSDRRGPVMAMMGRPPALDDRLDSTRACLSLPSIGVICNCCDPRTAPGRVVPLRSPRQARVISRFRARRWGSALQPPFRFAARGDNATRWVTHDRPLGGGALETATAAACGRCAVLMAETDEKREPYVGPGRACVRALCVTGAHGPRPRRATRRQCARCRPSLAASRVGVH